MCSHVRGRILSVLPKQIRCLHNATRQAGRQAGKQAGKQAGFHSTFFYLLPPLDFIYSCISGCNMTGVKKHVRAGTVSRYLQRALLLLMAIKSTWFRGKGEQQTDVPSTNVKDSRLHRSHVVPGCRFIGLLGRFELFQFWLFRYRVNHFALFRPHREWHFILFFQGITLIKQFAQLVAKKTHSQHDKSLHFQVSFSRCRQTGAFDVTFLTQTT